MCLSYLLLDESIRTADYLVFNLADNRKVFLVIGKITCNMNKQLPQMCFAIGGFVLEHWSLIAWQLCVYD